MIAWLVTILEFLAPWNRACPRPGQPLAVLDPATLTADLARQAPGPLEDRIRYWSGLFLDAPYAIDPMGEGEPPDTDPPIEVCAFDCETYVELVLALAFSRSYPEVLDWLDRMRHLDGRRNISSRFYTMALHWIPGNEKLGYLRQELLRPSSVVRRPVNPRGRWYPSHRARFDLLGPNAPSGTAEVRYHNLDTLLLQRDRIPTPALAFVVGAPMPGNPFLIMHMGFILQGPDGRRIFRHASRTVGRQRVEERELGDYLRSLRRFFNEPNSPRRTVLGLSLYRIHDPPAPSGGAAP